jgi:hypothetical protein
LRLATCLVLVAALTGVTVARAQRAFAAEMNATADPNDDSEQEHGR